MAKTAGCVGFDAEEHFSGKAGQSERHGNACQRSHRQHPRNLAQYQRDNAAAACPQGHPQTDFIGPPRDPERHHTEDPKAGNHERQKPEKTAQSRHDPFRHDGAVNQGGIRLRRCQPQPRVRLAYQLFERRRQAKRIAAATIARYL